jgi:hypothetical protein
MRDAAAEALAEPSPSPCPRRLESIKVRTPSTMSHAAPAARSASYAVWLARSNTVTPSAVAKPHTTSPLQTSSAASMPRLASAAPCGAHDERRVEPTRDRHDQRDKAERQNGSALLIPCA